MLCMSIPHNRCTYVVQNALAAYVYKFTYIHVGDRICIVQLHFFRYRGLLKPIEFLSVNFCRFIKNQFATYVSRIFKMVAMFHALMYCTT